MSHQRCRRQMGKYMSFPYWEVCGWSDSRAISSKFALLLHVSLETAECHTDECGWQGREQLGTLSHAVLHLLRKAEWMSYLSSPRLSPGSQCSLQQGFCVWRTISPGPLSQVNWEPERDASDLHSILSWWGSALGTGRIWCWSGGECTIKYPLSLLLLDREPSPLLCLTQKNFYLPYFLWHINLLTLTWVRKHSPDSFFFFIIWMSFLLKIWLLLTWSFSYFNTLSKLLLLPLLVSSTFISCFFIKQSLLFWTPQKSLCFLQFLAQGLPFV